MNVAVIMATEATKSTKSTTVQATSAPRLGTAAHGPVQPFTSRVMKNGVVSEYCHGCARRARELRRACESFAFPR